MAAMRYQPFTSEVHFSLQWVIRMWIYRRNAKRKKRRPRLGKTPIRSCQLLKGHAVSLRLITEIHVTYQDYFVFHAFLGSLMNFGRTVPRKKEETVCSPTPMQKILSTSFQPRLSPTTPPPPLALPASPTLQCSLMKRVRV